jgi:NadR type nicotinamide-nucleotide adenylyltransferase
MPRIGLTLGKYAPLHKGHQYVIETMLEEMDEVIVVIYASDVTNVPLPTRSAWIRELYPQVKVIEAWDGPVGVDHDPDYERAEEQYIKSLINETQLTAFYCSEYYGEHMAQALNCENRQVDRERLVVPISSTLIRSDAYKYRDYLDPLVYRDLVLKAVFLGAMSTGKSTLTEALAKRHNTTFAKEYGREYWTEHEVGRRFDLAGFDELADEHVRREDQAIRGANKYFFVDTNAITTYVYALDYHGRAPEHVTHLADANARRYDLFFLCDDDIPYDDTWDRSGDQKRHVFQRQVIADLEKRKLPYITLRGNLEERMLQVERELVKRVVH